MSVRRLTRACTPSAQACILLLVADVFVGYHSAEGWVTFLEMMVHRYSVMDLEEAEARLTQLLALET